MDFSGFTSIEAGSAFEVEITQADSHSLTITADDNLFEYIEVSKVGQTLTIGLKPDSNISSATLIAEIAMPALYGLHLSGATRSTAQGFSSSHDFILDLSGASTLSTRDMTVGGAEFDMSGASRLAGDPNGG